MSIFWHLRLKMGGRDYLLQSIMHEWTYLYSLSDNLAQLRLRFFPSYGHENKVGMFLGPHITKVESRKINWESKLGHVSKREKLRGHDWLMIDRFSRDRKKGGLQFQGLEQLFCRLMGKHLFQMGWEKEEIGSAMLRLLLPLLYSAGGRSKSSAPHAIERFFFVAALHWQL